jgi:hypothetical protein
MSAPDLDTLRAAIRDHGTEDVDVLLAAMSAADPALTRDALLDALEDLADSGDLLHRAAPPAEPTFGRRQFLATALGGAALSAAFAASAQAADVVCATEAAPIRLREQLKKKEAYEESRKQSEQDAKQAQQPKARIRLEEEKKREQIRATERLSSPPMQNALLRREKLREQRMKQDVRIRDYRIDSTPRPAYFDFAQSSMFAEISAPIPTDADGDCSFRLDVRVDGLDRNTQAPKDALGRIESAVRTGETVLLQHGPEGEQVMWIVITGFTYGWALPEAATNTYQELRARLTIAVVDEPVTEVIIDTDTPTDVPT